MIGSSPMSKRRTLRDDSTLYPENVDTGAARVVAVCFGGCSAVCLVLFYLVLSLAILPEMGGGDWQSVRCRAKEAYVAVEPSKVCRGKGDVNCDVETDPLVPTAGGLWEERCHDSITTTSCIRHVWANVLLEWEAPADTHRKVAHGVDRMAEEVHHTVERVMHKRTAERIPQKYLSVCYPYRCTGGESAVAMRRADAEAKATTLVGYLRNASGLLTSSGGVAAGADAGSGEWMRPGQEGEGMGGLKGLGFEGGGENFRGCAYSRSFYSSVPGISPLRHGAAAAVYLSRPTGYVDLPGGVTLLSILLLFLTGGCAVGLLCCLVSQCRAYGGVLSRGKSHTGHVL